MMRIRTLGAVLLGVALAAGTAQAGHHRYRDVVYVPATPVVVGAAPVALAPTAYTVRTAYAVPTAYVVPNVVATRTVLAAPAAPAYVVPTRVVRPRVVVADPLVVPATAVYAPVYGLYP